MTFSVLKITSVYFWLLVTLLDSGWAGNVSNNVEKKNVHVPHSGSLRQTSTATPTANIILRHIHRRQASRTESSSFCSAPQQPANGGYKLESYFCEDNTVDCSVSEGTLLEPGSQLVYNCNPGYRSSGNADVYCIGGGRWTNIPSCVEVQCESLNSPSTTATCTRYGKWMNCDPAAPAETRAEVSCRPGYKRDTDFVTTRSGVVNCNIHGNWEPNPIRCVPACGLVTTRQKPLAIGATPAKIGDFPWHASLFEKKIINKTETKQFKCGGTIIQSSLVLTAAHCVYDETIQKVIDASKLFIITGNVFRDYDSPLHNIEIVRKAAVKNVLTYCSYYGLLGNYNADIALLELQEPLEFSRILLPACLDDSGYNEQYLVPGVYGKVAGFGRTAETLTSATLQTLTVPYISYDECKNPKRASEPQVFFSSDKFCAGYNNGSAVCEGDSGGGLVFRKGDLWHVMGIVSVGLGVDTNSGERTCDKDSYTLYTRVSNYMTWIQHVLFYLERKQPFPACNPHSKPSVVTSTTPTSITPSVSSQNESAGVSNNNKTIEIESDCECVPYYLCRSSLTSNDGGDIIDIRIRSNDTECQNYLDVCCKSSDFLAPGEKPTTAQSLPKGCGKRNKDGVGFKITGDSDNESQFGEFPWTVAILRKELYNDDGDVLNIYTCVGALIHPQVVLTVAHCINGTNATELKIRSGEWDTQTKNEIYPHQDRDVGIVIMHGKYNPRSLANDIALLILKIPVEYAANVDVVCLPKGDEIIDESKCVASGWGKDAYGLQIQRPWVYVGKQGKYQEIMKKVNLTMVSHDSCQTSLQGDSRLGKRFVLDKSFICALATEGKDTCKGDGGGPLTCPLKDDPTTYVQTGITAWGIACGENKVPGVYANVAALRKWIDDQMVAKNFDTSVYQARPALLEI